jgi:glycerol uptake facilitator-like aquaporin
MAVQVDTDVAAVRRAADDPANPVTAANYGAERVGSVLLVFAITGTATAAGLGHAIRGSALGWLVVALVDAVALAASVSALAHVRGARFNPAVTMGLARVGKFPWRHVPGYAGVRVVGGVLAGLAIWVVERGPARGVLVFVVTAVAIDPRVSSFMAPLAISAAAVFIDGPVDAAAVNPARLLDPMIAAGEINAWWVLIAGPIAGGVLAAVACQKFVRCGTPSRVP